MIGCAARLRSLVRDGPRPTGRPRDAPLAIRSAGSAMSVRAPSSRAQIEARRLSEIHMTSSTPTARWTLAAGAIAVVVACSVPLWMGLGAADLQNDEAIYSYAVDRMLDTGDWITPRA